MDNTPPVQHRLYDLNRRTSLDNPSSVAAWPSFEEFCTLLFGAPWYHPDGQIIAADGDQWVGMASVGYIAETNTMDNMFTGVERAYRGRKIGLALKLLAIECARKYGATAMRTSNDSENAPMLAINQKLGYQPHAGRYRLMQDLHERDTHTDSVLPIRSCCFHRHAIVNGYWFVPFCGHCISRSLNGRPLNGLRVSRSPAP